MKSRMKQMIQAAAIVILGAFSASTAMGQNSGVDASPSFPQVMTVERVNFSDNTVVLDGELYRLPDESQVREAPGDSVAQSDQGRVPFIGALEQGMKVRVVTDGSLPSDSHVPFILELEPAR